MNEEFIKWLDDERALSEDFFTVYEICRKLKKHPNNVAYRSFNRMVAYGLLDYKYCKERHAMLYRRKKNE